MTARKPATKQVKATRLVLKTALWLLFGVLLAEQHVPALLQALLAGDQPLRAAITAEGRWYRAYFTRPAAGPGGLTGGIDQPLAADIAAARRSVDVASFDFDQPSLADALISARRRGVHVRLVVDGENLADPAAALLVGKIEQVGIPVTIDRRAAFMHNKFIVIDDERVWTGSMNLTSNDIYRNNNNMLRISSPRIAGRYTARFEQLAGGRSGRQARREAGSRPVTTAGRGSVEIYFSPNGGGQAAIIRRLQGARSSINVLAFSLTDVNQVGVLIEKHRQGIAVQAVVEQRNATGLGAQFGVLKAAGVDVLLDGNCNIMHHKVYIIDRRTVITGSYNFTANAERNNDENLLIIDDPALASHYLEEFNYVAEQARNPPRCP